MDPFLLAGGLNARRRRASGGGAWALSVPTFGSLAVFNSASGLTVAGGAVKATTAGVAGTGILTLPATVDTTKAFHMGALFEYQGGADRAAVRLENPSDTSFLGMSFSIDSGDLRAESGTQSFFKLLTGLTAGDRFWLGLAWDDTGDCCVWSCFDTHGAFNNAATFQGPVHYDYVNRIDRYYAGGSAGRGAFSQGLSQIAVRTSSATTKILSIFARQGDYQTGPSSRVECPILFAPIVAGDATALVRAPEWTPGTPRDLVLCFHGANSSETTGHAVGGGADDGAAIAGLVEAGYVVAYMRGTSDVSGTTYSGPLASNWGAPTQLATWWKALLDTIRRKFAIRNVYLLGLSMGLENALRFYATYPEAIKAIAGISGVCNLTYAYNSEGFKAGIDAAYGTSTAGAIAPYDPTLTPALFTGVPIKLWHGDADATLAIAQHMTAFAAAVNALSPGRVATVTVAGGTHLGASMFQAAALLAFLQANP